MNVIRTALVVAAMLLFAGSARGTQTPAEVAHDAWERAVSRLAKELVSAADETAVNTLLSDGFAIRTFDGKPATLAQTMSTTASAAWCKPLAYDTAPDLLATDFGALALAEEGIDPFLRRYLTPASDSAARTANGTALKWIAQVLAPRADQPVGVIVLFHPAGEGQLTHGKVTIVLAAGERVGARLYRVKRLAFGQFDVPKPS